MEYTDEFEQFWSENFEEGSPMLEDQKWAIVDLLEVVTLTDQELDGIKLMMAQSPTFSDARQLIGYLYSRMPHPVTERGRYSIKDLTKHINEITKEG